MRFLDGAGRFPRNEWDEAFFAAACFAIAMYALWRW
jgi:hypothetical protein